MFVCVVFQGAMFAHTNYKDKLYSYTLQIYKLTHFKTYVTIHVHVHLYVLFKICISYIAQLYTAISVHANIHMYVQSYSMLMCCILSYFNTVHRHISYCRRYVLHISKLHCIVKGVTLGALYAWGGEFQQSL